MAYKQRKKPFFLVWTPATGYTRKRHLSADKAITEAQRLADLHPEYKYHVLMSFGACVADKGGK